MKKLPFLFIFLLGFIYPPNLQAQIQNHSQFSYKFSKNEVKVGETVELIITATIDKDWYVYAIERDEAVMAQMTAIEIENNNSFQAIGSLKAMNPKKKYDEIWPGNYTYFKGKGEFRQTFKILKKDFKIEGRLTYQTCSDITGQCVPGKKTFSFSNKDIKVIEAKSTEEKTEEKAKNEEKTEEDKDAEEENATETEEENKEDSTEEATVTKPSEKGNNKPKEGNIEASQSQATVMPLGTIIGLAIFYGIFAILTPCVFPMVPMTVTFFLKQSKTKREGRAKALIYGASIVAIYTIVGTIVAMVFGAKFANWLSTHWVPNILFFLIFVVFGMSFLGMFEIVLPSSWISKADKQADKGGYMGIFFMAFVLVLVSFSCTGPLVGSILVEASRGGFVRPIIGMLVFSATLALPFTLFAMFPSMLKSLPKSGGWLNSVKVVLGFIELALALKFLSIPDQVYHWGILDRDIYIAFWIVIFGMLGFYLLGKIRLPHDSPMEKVPVPRAMLAIVSLSFVVYLIPGMFGAPLKPLAGYLPPQTTIDFDLVTGNEVELIVERKLKRANLNVASNGNLEEGIDFKNVKYADKLHLPHGLEGFFDYKQALAYAKKVNKPIFVDFTGHGCVNCREMENSVWADKKVLQRLEDNFVIVALYIDERTRLPKKEWYESSFDGSMIKTVGDLNADLQITKFNNNAQPYYCLLNHEGKLLVSPKDFDKNVENFVKFLDKGVKNFEAGKTAKSGNLAGK